MLRAILIAQFRMKYLRTFTMFKDMYLIMKDFDKYSKHIRYTKMCSTFSECFCKQHIQILPWALCFIFKGWKYFDDNVYERSNQ